MVNPKLKNSKDLMLNLLPPARIAANTHVSSSS